MNRWARRSGEPATEPEPERVIHLEDAAEPESPPTVDIEKLREVLVRYAESGVPERDLEAVSRFVTHPDPEIRRLALRALAHDDREPPTGVRRALDDPVDEVRAAAVPLVARMTGALPALLPIAADRAWPKAQAAAFDVLPELLAANPAPSVEDISVFMLAVGIMPSPPLDREIGPLRGIVRALGAELVAPSLATDGPRRVGAARLLVAEGSSVSLRHVAELRGDPDPEVAASADLAVVELGTPPSIAPEEERSDVPLVTLEAGGVPLPEPPPAAPEGSDAAKVRALALDLLSPDRVARERAMSELQVPGWGAVLAWTREVLAHGSDEDAALAAHLAEELMFSQAAPAILARAAALPWLERGPFVRALTSFALDPGALLGLVTQVPSIWREEALRIVWEIGGRAVLPGLIEELRDQTVEGRRAVLGVLAETRDPSVFELADRTLSSDPSASMREAALRLLARGGPDLRRGTLERAMLDPQGSVRAQAISLLTRDGGTEGERALLAALEDPNDDVSAAAVGPLADLVADRPLIVWTALKRARPRQRDSLMALLADEHPEELLRLSAERSDSADPDDRVLAAELATRAGPRGAAIVAGRALEDPVPSVRLASARALAQGGGPEVLTALGRLLKDPDPEIRLQAVAALALRDERSVLGPLLETLADPDPGVRSSVMDALVRMASPALVERLIGALERPELRESASEVLLELGPFVGDRIADRLSELDPDARRTAGALLRRTIGLEELTRRLGSIWPGQRRGAVGAIAAIGGPDAVASLTRMLTDPDPGIRAEVLTSLGEIGDTTAAEAVRGVAADDPVAEVRETAVAVLGDFGADAPTR